MTYDRKAGAAPSGTTALLSAAAIAEGAGSRIIDAPSVGTASKFGINLDATISFTGSAQTFFDSVAQIGWNVGNGGSQRDAARGSAYIQIEDDFWSSALTGSFEHTAEAHMQFFGPGSTNSRRAWSFQYGWTSGKITGSIAANIFSFTSSGTQVGLYSDDGQGVGHESWGFFARQIQLGTNTAFIMAGNLETTDAWLDARGSAADVALNLRSKGGFNIVMKSHVDITDAKNINLGTGTGTKIGTATTQKLGFFNKTPVVQPTTPGADATDLASAITLVNTIKARLVSLGLTA